MKGILRKDFVENVLPLTINGIIFAIFLAVSLTLVIINIDAPYLPDDPEAVSALSIFQPLCLNGVFLPICYGSSLVFGQMLRDMKSGWIGFLVSVGAPRKRIAAEKLVYITIIAVILWLSVLPQFYAISVYQSTAMDKPYLGWINMISWLNILPLTIAMSLGATWAAFSLSPNIASLVYTLTIVAAAALGLGGALGVMVLPEAGPMALLIGLVAGAVFVLAVGACIGLYLGFKHHMVTKDM